MMKIRKYMFSLILLFQALSFLEGLNAQTSTITIETNKVVGLYNFLETATRAAGTSSTYRNFIIQALGNDKDFDKLIQRYIGLNIRYHLEREEFPESRNAFKTTKDFIWIASTNSESIQDLSERIIGYLPHDTHSAFIDILEQLDPYYTKLVWNKELERTKKIAYQLSFYESEIDSLYRLVTTFYGTTWNQDIPFKVVVYPIPLDSGVSTAIAKGNALICSFLSRNELDYMSVLGVIVHEMCHVLYEAQSLEMQQNMDTWFQNSDSKFKQIAAFYINEGLATTIGNGWAYEKIHGRIDTNEWYSNEYIDGYAHAIFDKTSQYLENNKTIDADFISYSIAEFEKAFPNALYRTKTLIYSHYLFANAEEEGPATKIAEASGKFFSIQSMLMSTPIQADESIADFFIKGKTKIFVIDSNHANTIAFLQEQYKSEPIPSAMNTLYSFVHNPSESVIILIQLDDIENIDFPYKKLLEMRTMEFNKSIQF